MLILMQGVPGSGKSTLAKKLLAEDKTHNTVVCSTDDYFYINGVYKFRPEMLQLFHQLNFERACDLLMHGYNVIIDNTNITQSAVQPYIDCAKHYGHKVKVIRCDGEYENTHGVPDEVVEKMRKKMEVLSTR